MNGIRILLGAREDFPLQEHADSEPEWLRRDVENDLGLVFEPLQRKPVARRVGGFVTRQDRLGAVGHVLCAPALSRIQRPRVALTQQDVHVGVFTQG